MKFHVFHMMPYPNLPRDLHQTVRSVSVDAPSSLYDPQVGHLAYNDYLDELEYAEAVGFDGLTVNEHHQNAYQAFQPSPNLMLAALARRTSRAKLVLLGNPVVLYNPPTRVAEEIAMLDVLSGGRVVAGFPVGLPNDSAFSYGRTPATLRDQYRESLELVLRAWTEPKVFSFNGKYTQLRYVNIFPRPVQKPHPPVWIPSGGVSIETWELCAENDFLYAYLSWFGHKSAEHVMDNYWERLARRNKAANPYRAAFMQFVAVAEDDAEAERLYAEPLMYYYRARHFPGFANPPGYASINSVRAAVEGHAPGGTRFTDFAKLTWKEAVKGGQIIAGSPDTVVEQLDELATRLNVGHLIVQMHFGNMSRETTFYNTRRFAQEVIPRLRNRFNEWEDKWWPSTTLAKIATPAPLSTVTTGTTETAES